MELTAIKRDGLHRVLRTLLPSYNNSVWCSFQSSYSRAYPLSLLLNRSSPPHPSYPGAKPIPCSNNFTSLFRDGYKRLSNFQGRRESRRSELGGPPKRPSVQTLSTLGSGGPPHYLTPPPRDPGPCRLLPAPMGWSLARLTSARPGPHSLAR